MPENGDNLRLLYAWTHGALSDARVITRALDWVDHVVPRFADACRISVEDSDNAVLDLWLDWLESDRFQVIQEAGKGAIYEWRRSWLRILLTVTRAVKTEGPHLPAEECLSMAESLWTGHVELATCFPVAFWRKFVDFLAGSPSERAAAPLLAARCRHYSMAFPLVLSQPFRDGNAEMKTILAHFVYEPTGGSAATMVLHPGQAALRCMDAQFARSISDASQLVYAEFSERTTPVPDVQVRINAINPAHERILAGMVLSGPSAGGALAVGLHGLLVGNRTTDRRTAISFSLSGGRMEQPDRNCLAVAGIDEKAPGCVQQGIRRLILEKEQHQQSMHYARSHGLETLGASDLAEAISLALGRRIVLLYHRHAHLDRSLAARLEQILAARGHQVFIDRNLPVGIEWARTIEQWIQDADAVVPILSSQSLVSEMLAYEIETAHDARQRPGNKPRLLPVRVDYEGPVPDRIAHILDPLHHAIWQNDEDDSRLVEELEQSLDCEEERVRDGYLPGVTSAFRKTPDDLEPFDGLVPLGSPFYVSRDTDKEYQGAISQRHSIILIKGPRQTGKSSLLARGLHHAEQSGSQIVLTDFQKMSRKDLSSLAAFYRALARMLARQLKIEASLENLWIDRRSENINFEEYVEDHVLPRGGNLVWGIDEADRLFAFDYCSDVFGLFRSWANERQGRADSPWARLTLSISYATEAHLFIQDQNQSPFNIGTRLELKDFTLSQISLLNILYGQPLRSDEEAAIFHDLVGGHPYLVRRGLYAMTRDKIDVRQFATEATADAGPIGDHLRRIVTLLAHNEANRAAMQEVLVGRPCPTYETFYHLRSAGIVVGDSAREAQPRCRLYADYLRRQLLY